MLRNRGSNKSFLLKVCDSTPAKTIGLISGILGILALLVGPVFQKQPAEPIKSAASAPTVQHSSGAQSPNVNSVRHDVRVQQGSTIQSSRGAQSPNVNGVGGNVNIRYGSPTATAAQELPESQQ